MTDLDAPLIPALLCAGMAIGSVLGALEMRHGSWVSVAIPTALLAVLAYGLFQLWRRYR